MEKKQRQKIGRFCTHLKAKCVSSLDHIYCKYLKFCLFCSMQHKSKVHVSVKSVRHTGIDQTKIFMKIGMTWMC